MFADLLGDPPSKLNSKSVSPAKDVYKKNVVLFTYKSRVQVRKLAIYSGSIHYIQSDIPQSAESMDCTPTDIAKRNPCHIDTKAETKGKG